jgi:hypothetical protein
VAKEELDRRWSNENEEAYQPCEVWQQEINMLRKDLEELRGVRESGSEENEGKCEREKNLANLSPKIVSCADDNCPRIQQQASNVLYVGKDEDNDDEKRDSIIDQFEYQQLRSNYLQQEEKESHHEEHFVNTLIFENPIGPMTAEDTAAYADAANSLLRAAKRSLDGDRRCRRSSDCSARRTRWTRGKGEDEEVATMTVAKSGAEEEEEEETEEEAVATLLGSRCTNSN